MTATSGRDDIKAILMKAFKAVDRDGNGFIDRNELKDVLTSFYQSSKKPYDAAKLEEDSNKFFLTVDRNDDQKVTLEEFVQYYLGHFCP